MTAPAPTREPAGTALLRLGPELSRLVAIAAASRRQSQHAWLLAAARAALLHQAQGGDTAVRAELATSHQEED